MQEAHYRPLGSRERVADPTTDEIKARCEEIRSTWSEREHRNRSGMTRYRWRVPQDVPVEIQSLLESE